MHVHTRRVTSPLQTRELETLRRTRLAVLQLVERTLHLTYLRLIQQTDIIIYVYKTMAREMTRARSFPASGEGVIFVMFM
jgi:hypothetical protein